MEHIALALETLSPQARRAADPASPEPARLAAAQGLIALPPPQLLPLLYNLALDTASEAVRKAALKSIEQLPVPLAVGAVKAGLPPIVLDFVARKRLRDDEVVEAVLLAPAVLDETVKQLAAQVGERQCEIIAQNEMRLLRFPEVIEALYLNPRARMSTVQRCVELAVRQGIVLEGLPAYRELAAAITGKYSSHGGAPATGVAAAGAAAEGDAGRELAADAVRAAAELAAFDADDADLADVNFSEAMRVAAEAGGDGAGGAAAAATEPLPAESDKGPLLSQLSGMTITQKIRAATLGNQSIRAVLVRDANRLVALAAIKSPRIGDSEIAAYSQSRAVNDDVIRYIASNRDFFKSHVVRVSLANNPKCPVPTALRILPMLRPNELKALSNNKNVAHAVAEQARRLLAHKQK
ncbi:MAG TPA: hypothetical protein VG389_12965 [Myxococcota bacterium]|nr:hypothetical protein [Myxococcota bacterium]